MSSTREQFSFFIEGVTVHVDPTTTYTTATYELPDGSLRWLAGTSPGDARCIVDEVTYLDPVVIDINPDLDALNAAMHRAQLQWRFVTERLPNGDLWQWHSPTFRRGITIAELRRAHPEHPLIKRGE